jgi:purine-binding chemotaxis protein CheW
MNDVSMRIQQGNATQEYIAFNVGQQTYCIDIIAVREIRGWTPATPLPHAPSFVRGVINLRGSVLPVVDLAARLGWPVKEPTARHALIVVHANGQIVGLLVEAVSNIMTLSPDGIQPAPEVASDPSKSFIQDIVAVDNEIISVLIVQNLLPERLSMSA